MSIVNNILAFCGFIPWRMNIHPIQENSLARIQCLMMKIDCVEQNFFLGNFLNSFDFLQVMKTV